MGKRVLIIDGDKTYSDYLLNHLKGEGFTVEKASDGVEGLALFIRFEPEIVLSEMVLSGKDGLQVCREIREKSSVPFLFISGKSDVFDKVLGLEMGADDYLVKPFEPKELVARMKAVIRRYDRSGEEKEKKYVRYDNLEVNIQKYEVKLKGEPVAFPPKEIQLLFFMASHPNETFTRDTLLDKVWGYDYLGDSRTVDVHVKRLRTKLQGISREWDLKTVWGIGYKFEVNSAD